MQSIIVLSLFGVSMWAQHPEPSQGRGQVPPQVTKPLVEGLTLSLDDPSVVGALGCIAKNLPLLKLQSTLFASQRSMPRIMITLRCHVIGEEGMEMWEFVVSRKTGGAWRLRSARCMEE